MEERLPSKVETGGEETPEEDDCETSAPGEHRDGTGRGPERPGGTWRMTGGVAFKEEKPKEDVLYPDPFQLRCHDQGENE